MGTSDLPLEELTSYRPEGRAPDDFDEVWAATLAESRSVPMQPRVVPAGALIGGWNDRREVHSSIFWHRINLLQLAAGPRRRHSVRPKRQAAASVYRSTDD